MIIPNPIKKTVPILGIPIKISSISIRISPGSFMPIPPYILSFNSYMILDKMSLSVNISCKGGQSENKK